MHDSNRPTTPTPASLPAFGALAGASVSCLAGLLVWPLGLLGGAAADAPGPLAAAMAVSVCLVMGLAALVLLAASFLGGPPASRRLVLTTLLCLTPFALLAMLVVLQLSGR
ncbi:MAG: hypothetical protein ABSC03_09180 [Verrucomicrobiota bacterium]|jgi:hypothetical protein